MRISDWPLARRLALAFGGVITIFLVITLIALNGQRRLKQAQDWNLHTVNALGLSADLLVSVVNMETGGRGFLLSGDTKFLEPWDAGIKLFEQTFLEVKKLTEDNPAQQKRLEEMLVAYQKFTTLERELQDIGLLPVSKTPC